MKRATAAILALCLLFLTACQAGEAASREPEDLPEESAWDPEAWTPQPVQDWVFAVSRDAPQSLRTAAEYFCAQMERITEGRIDFSVVESIAPDADLIAGRAQAAFLNKKRQFAFSPPLAATATPFLYSGYKNFTVRANAPSTLGVLENSLRQNHGMVPLGAYYQGALHLLTDFPVNNYSNFEYSMIAVSYDTGMQSAIARLGGETVVADSDEERFELFWIGEVTGAELSLEEMAKHGEELPQQSYFTVGSHNLIPAWLVVKEDFFDSLTPAQQAGTLEICAYMTNLIDDPLVKREELMMESLYIPNLAVVADFSNVRNRVFNTLPTLEATATVEERAARDLIDRMRRIS